MQMTSGGQRQGAGRKPYSRDQLRKLFTVRLHQDVIKWFKAQPKSNSVIIEDFVNEHNSNKKKD